MEPAVLWHRTLGWEHPYAAGVTLKEREREKKRFYKITNVREGMEKREPSYTVGRNIN